MKGLRVQVVVGTLLAALAPVLLAGYFARTTLEDRGHVAQVEEMDRAVAAASRRVEARIDGDRQALRQLCERDFVVDRLLVDLAAGRFDASRQHELVELLPQLMDSMRLDVLFLLDARSDRRGVILAAGHHPERAGARDDDLARDGERAGERPFLRDVRVPDDGGSRNGEALLGACLVERGEARIQIVGGRLLGGEYISDLASGAGHVDLVLTETSPGAEPGGKEREVHRFDGANGEAEAYLVALLDDSELVAQLAELDRGLLVAGGLGVFLALLISVLSTLWLSKPLIELEDATRRVGAGDLDATVTVRPGGEVGKAIGAFNDMTRELRRTQRKLLRAERIAAWRDIARRIAHEIKNPLSPIQISIETMRKTYKKDHPDFPEIFEESTLTILEEVERLRRIVTEFSQFARMPRPRSDVLDVGEIVAHVAQLHQYDDVSVTVETSGSPSPIRGDRDQLTQVLENLIKNAIEATRGSHPDHDGAVLVIVEQQARGVVLRIQDGGPGIPETDRLRIFEPYYTTKAGGTGLGLAIVHRIVDDHGGSVEIHDAPSGGAEFRIQLPEEGPPPEASASVTGAAAPLIQPR